MIGISPPRIASPCGGPKPPGRREPDLDSELSAWLVGKIVKGGFVDAPAVAEISSDRPDRFGGADICTHRSDVGGQPCRLRPPACGSDLLRQHGLDYRSDRPNRPASRARRLLLRLQCVSHRRVARHAADGSRDAVSPIPARGLARRCARSVLVPNRLSRPGARASAVDVNLAAIGRPDVFTTQHLRRISCLPVFCTRACQGSR